MESVNYIITAKHYATREGCSSVYERITKLARVISQRGAKVFVAGPEPRGFTVNAEIEFGQWIARCPCGGVEMVDPDEPIFYCFGCGNRTNNGYLRPVSFPAQREDIERLVLERPVDDQRGLDDLDRAFQSRPVLIAQVINQDGNCEMLPLTRSWVPGESVEDLLAQNEPVYVWMTDQAAKIKDGE